MGAVVELKPWEVVSFAWGTAVRKKNGEWTHLFVGGQEIIVEALPLHVVLSDNGIEFIEKEK